MLGRYERGHNGEAVVQYGDGTMRVVKPGSFVRCAVTGEPIPLDELRYWSATRQEAYASPEAILKQLKETGRP
ncbi:DUF2093 domain-containing protein [Methylobacterium sp. J-077]|uniref:DUF2093 domain-containing protein n=1 Tax=Methylobacterium sp. J-077 TaxID=2836656 RepID=UPI001FBA80DF|nr:DUF2093 domain-containing protein [Methylobacterium sp. J-077]MCJ2122696.1 DUF2093 domain-containing protein [Methylobacterium sp. J-077]